MKQANCIGTGVMILEIVGCLLLLSQVSRGDFTFGIPTNLGPIVNGPDDVVGVSISVDGLELYFASNRVNGYGSYDLWLATRSSANDDWDVPVNLGPVVNSSYPCMSPSISTDGLQLVYSDSEYGPFMPGGIGSTDLWMVTRETKEAAWSAPVNIGPPINYYGGDISPTMSADGLSFYFASGAARGGFGLYDLWVATRPTIDDDWNPPVNLGRTVNSSAAEFSPSLSSDGLMMFFCRTSVSQSYFDLWMTRRVTVESEWGTPVKLEQLVNTSFSETFPSISTDGSILYFCSDRAGGFGQQDIWHVSIEPIVDLNGDGIVDAEDVRIMIDYWGTDEPLCDIGPMPWGDGVVDVQDLIVLAEHLFENVPSPGRP